MLIDNTTLFEPQHSLIINSYDNHLFYYFDYDTRYYEINMEFQHFHPFFEIMIPLSEGINHLIEGLPYYLNVNDIVLLAPSVLHKTIYPKGNPCKRIIISFLFPDSFWDVKDTYEEILSVFHNPVPIYRFSFDKRQKLFSILNDIFEHSRSVQKQNTQLNNFYTHIKFQEFLYELCALEDENIYKNNQDLNSMETKIYNIASYIHMNYQENLTLDSLAAQFYMSPGYLSHQFKKLTHFGLLEYIQITRIRNVQYRLITTNEKISDIAFSCGFSSFSQFNRIFQKITSTSPSEFRKQGLLPS